MKEIILVFFSHEAAKRTRDWIESNFSLVNLTVDDTRLIVEIWGDSGRITKAIAGVVALAVELSSKE